MTEAELRAFVRNELPSDERKNVARWLVRCTDPDLPVLLQGLVREYRDEQADAALRSAGRSGLVDAWEALLAAGRVWTSGLEPTLVPAAEGGAPVLVIEVLGGLRFVVAHPSEISVLVLTDDEGTRRVLAGPGRGPLRGELAPPFGTRPTVWLMSGQSADPGSEGGADAVAAMRLDDG